jgi:hypothetical protein
VLVHFAIGVGEVGGILSLALEFTCNTSLLQFIFSSLLSSSLFFSTSTSHVPFLDLFSDSIFFFLY